MSANPLENALRQSINAARLPRLEHGDHLDQPTFHARSEWMPRGTWAELICGRVYLHSRVRIAHGSLQAAVAGWLGNYDAQTAGAQAVGHATIILGDDSEPQPDASLRILLGGQTKTSADDYIVGCPELVCEVASSSESYDLHEKLADFDRYGAKEYVAVLVRTGEVWWFGRGSDGRLTPTQPDADGIFRSKIFPGLWLDPAAIIRGDGKRVLEVLSLGLATPEHAAFAMELKRREPAA